MNTETFNTSGQEIEQDLSIAVDTNIAILQTVCCVLFLIIGTPLNLGIIYYEREGVDAQKRSIYNQLISSFFGYSLIATPFVGLINTIRCWVGPLGHFIALITSFVRRFALTEVVITLLEIMIYKILCILKPHCIMGLDDNFWAVFLLIWNGIFAVVPNNVDWYYLASEGKQPPIYFFIAGSPDMDPNSHQYQ